MDATVKWTHVLELALGDCVAVKDDSIRFEVRRLVELDQQLGDHRREFLDHLLPVLLHAHRGRVSRRVAVHRPHDRSNRRLLRVSCRRVSHVSAHEDDGLVEHLVHDGEKGNI